jgi:hypothetical protein
MGQGFGPMQDLTSAQILFLSLAGMEDAQIKAGNGLVKRDGSKGSSSMDSDIEYSRNYAKLKRDMKPGGDLLKEMEKIKKEQASFRAGLEAEIKRELEKEARYS